MSYSETIADGTILGDVPGILPGTLFVTDKSFMTRSSIEDCSRASHRMDHLLFFRADMRMIRLLATSLFTPARAVVI